MNRAIGLHPIVVILAVTIGAQQGGPVGALLAIPVTTVGYIFFQEWQERRSV
jgi:predicted PurR-regulated permease PerM